jgi:hypothetical protein
MDAVHRLNGSGYGNNKPCLRYSRSYCESSLADEGLYPSIIDASLELLGGIINKPLEIMLVAGSRRSFPQDSRNSVSDLCGKAND